MEEILIKNVSKTYVDDRGNEFKALSDVSLSWKNGEILSLVGESGSGKSTLAKLLIGIEQADAGTIKIEGISLADINRKEKKNFRQLVQGVFQDARGTMNPSHSVYSNVEEAIKNLTKINKAQRKKRIEELMVALSIDRSILKNSVRSLSGGEERRLALIRALAIQPKYLILDEVTSGLDVKTTESLLNLLEEYRKKFGIAYLFITHDLKSAYQISNRILKIKNGKIIEVGNKIY